jgi:Glycosyltransferase 61
LHNQIAFDRQPDALILDPYNARSLSVLGQPDFLWRPIPRTLIAGFAASAHGEINAKIDSYLAYTARNKVFHKAIEFNTFPVLLEDAWFRKSFVSVDDRCLISGAAGTRLLNRYCWENAENDPDAEQKLIDYFLSCQAQPDKSLPVVAHPLPPDTPFAVECRNTFNYFHFVTESLCQLCLVQEAGLTGPVYVHYPNNDEKTRPFAMNFIKALFPELADRVVFQRAPVHHDRVVTPYNFANSFYQMPAAEVGLMDLHAPSDLYWKGPRATRGSQGVLAMNALDSSLLKLRARAHAAIQGQDFSHLPRRFWVGRENDLARPRLMKGEAEILDMLKLFGFEFVAFERLNPLEQVAIMANAEMMVSYHGAGFTNMLFAGPQTYVIELGTLQTAMFRWGDFWRLANASGCRYISFFADFNADDPLKEPAFAQDGIVPVHLSPAGLAQVMSLIVAVLGHTPKFTRPDEVQRLGVQLVKIGALDRAAALYAAHAGLEQGHVGLSLAMADCHDRRGDSFRQLAALHSAYGADPTNWAILIRIVWCARTLDLHDALHAALLALQDGFPDRFAAFSRERPWVHKHLSDAPHSKAS